jgi:TonB family protein
VSLPSGGAGPLEAPKATPPAPAARKKAPPPAPPAEKPKPKAKKAETIKLPEPGKTPPPQPAAKPEAEPASAPAPAAGVTPPGASPEAGPAPGVGGAGAPGFGEQPDGGIGALDAETFEFAWYRAAITQKLRTAWSKPHVQNLSAPLRAVVYFKVMRNGRIVEIHLESSSGLETLDRSALRAVYDANPLPPLPYAYLEETLGVHFYFELVPEP